MFVKIQVALYLAIWHGKFFKTAITFSVVLLLAELHLDSLPRQVVDDVVAHTPLDARKVEDPREVEDFEVLRAHGEGFERLVEGQLRILSLDSLNDNGS